MDDWLNESESGFGLLLSGFDVGGEEAEDEVGGGKVLGVPGVFAALYLVDLDIGAVGRVGVEGVVDGTPGVAGKRLQGVARHGVAAVVDGDGADSQGRGDVCAPAAFVGVVALPGRGGVVVAVDLHEGDGLGEAQAVVDAVEGETGHRGVGFEQLGALVGQLVAQVAAVRHSGQKDIFAVEAEALHHDGDEGLEEVGFVDLHGVLRRVMDVPAGFAARVGRAVGVADGVAVFVGGLVEVLAAACLRAVAVGAYHQGTAGGEAVGDVHRVGAHGVAVRKFVYLEGGLFCRLAPVGDGGGGHGADGERAQRRR